MTLSTALLGWLYVSSAAALAFLVLVNLYEVGLWLHDEWRIWRRPRVSLPPLVDEYPLIDQLADIGEYELMEDRDRGIEHLLPKQRRAA